MLISITKDCLLVFLDAFVDILSKSWFFWFTSILSQDDFPILFKWFEILSTSLDTFYVYCSWMLDVVCIDVAVTSSLLFKFLATLSCSPIFLPERHINEF